MHSHGSCWALCCVPWAPHQCLMARGQSILNETSQLHGALSLPRPLCCCCTQSHPSPFTPSPPLAPPWVSRLLLEEQHPLQLRWSLACSLWLQGGMQSFQASSLRAFRCFQCISAGHGQEEQMKGSPAMGSHRGCQQLPQPHTVHLQMAPKSHLDLSSRHCSQGKETLDSEVMTWSNHCIPQGPPMKIGAGSRARLQAPLSSRVLQFAAPSSGLSGLMKAKVRHRSPCQSSCKGDAGESFTGKKSQKALGGTWINVQWLHLWKSSLHNHEDTTQ